MKKKEELKIISAFIATLLAATTPLTATAQESGYNLTVHIATHDFGDPNVYVSA